MYEYRAEFETGIQFIDEEHRRLFEIAEEAYELRQNEFIVDKYDYLARIVKELEDYTKMHFAHEEAYMEEIGYNGMFTQKVQHDSFLKMLEDMDEHFLVENSEDGIDNILTFLTNWLVGHILNVDKLIPDMVAEAAV